MNSQTEQPSKDHIEIARELVIALLRATGIDILDLSRLRVIVGGGNWISWECAFAQRIENSPEAIVRGLSKFGERKVIRAVASLGEGLWFRTETRPSLHFLVQRADGKFALAGHVDAAAPHRNPFVHLFQDYLPARGLGTHPGPGELWAEWNRFRVPNR